MVPTSRKKLGVDFNKSPAKFQPSRRKKGREFSRPGQFIDL
ncbi:hypothetical protein AEST_07260 [Alishewanella aestuarii B11]|uniref:Uncharacterized protein n=1 Tax=Alishewanella aestuarii B11 TaxID=1197174 RepID=J1YEQ5_9ALTE|nr:hypothetical protein AEST_07260 [Alishewanella aestuarii B11]